MATREALEAHGIDPASVNVITRGVHARRSRLIFEKALGPGVEVGVIGWVPTGEGDLNWRASTVRAEAFLQESVGYVYELLWDSGR